MTLASTARMTRTILVIALASLGSGAAQADRVKPVKQRRVVARLDGYYRGVLWERVDYETDQVPDFERILKNSGYTVTVLKAPPVTDQGTEDEGAEQEKPADGELKPFIRRVESDGFASIYRRDGVPTGPR
jgi:hypothetical protein